MYSALAGACEYSIGPVSYTHLDVYKRQGIRRKRYRTVDRQGNYGVDEPEIRRNQLRKRR